jgi:hypothetical protein
MHPLRIEYRALDQLKPYPRNARTHSKKQIRQIAESIRQFGFTNPIIVDGDGVILAGHGRVEAARLLDFTSIPCVRIDHISPEQKRAYILADNRLAQNAGWNEEILATELQFLLESEIDFEIGVIGFETHEIDRLIDGLNQEEVGDPADDTLPNESERDAPSRDSAIYGCSASIACYAPMPPQRRHFSVSCKGSVARWCSRTLPTMFLLPGTLAALVRHATANSSWAPAK